MAWGVCGSLYGLDLDGSRDHPMGFHRGRPVTQVAQGRAGDAFPHGYRVWHLARDLCTDLMVMVDRAHRLCQNGPWMDFMGHVGDGGRSIPIWSAGFVVELPDEILSRLEPQREARKPPIPLLEFRH